MQPEELTRKRVIIVFTITIAVTIIITVVIINELTRRRVIIVFIMASMPLACTAFITTRKGACHLLCQ